MALAKGKTEHNGAKNGGGMYGPRAEAKAASKKRRRRADKTAAEGSRKEAGYAS